MTTTLHNKKGRKQKNLVHTQQTIKWKRKGKKTIALTHFFFWNAGEVC